MRSGDGITMSRRAPRAKRPLPDISAVTTSPGAVRGTKTTRPLFRPTPSPPAAIELFSSSTCALFTHVPCRSSAQALLDQQIAAEKILKSNMLVAASKALNVLTTEQRGKLGSFISEHEARER